MDKGSKEGVVPISWATASLLSAWLASNGKSKWLFPSSNNGNHWGIGSFERAIKRVRKHYGIKPITPPALRHFYATHNLKMGQGLR